ncbi:hypothetical protein [Agrococcus sp. HG114]|uniref:hypothetical protein n=1 Tax=Agrococcus sp. HG114 TaxID=2969757 RepID=UPI00215AEA56|nr:hypothetical protein [Agrococcus sp. HG114]MCR8671811.1 hypothetical protein [Agrococcus sp. HG114]
MTAEHPPADASGESAIALAVVAGALLALPMVGDAASLAAALAAVGVGLLGIRRHARGRARHVWPALLGTLAGALIALVAAILLLA